MDLTQEQADAVNDLSTLVAVSARPGSGKTRVVIAKVKQLVEQGIEPWVLTFTTKAAKEIRDRIDAECGVNLQRCGTFHSVFYDGRSPVACELEEKDKQQLWKQEEGEYPTITYDMILASVLERGLPEVPSHCIVDECQDNDETQWKIVQMLIDMGTTVMLVGDLDQSIYGWRDAVPEVAEHYFRMAADKYNARHELTQSFRNHPDITRFARGVLANEATGENSCVRKQGVFDFLSQGAHVDAILCRTNRDVDIMCRMLGEHNVPVSQAVDRKSLQKFQAWMGLIAMPFSVSKFVAATGVGRKELALTRKESMRKEIPMLQAYREATGNREFDIAESVSKYCENQLNADAVSSIYLTYCGDSERAAMQLAQQFGSHTPKDAAAEACVGLLTPTTDAGVKVMTMHGAKGLEFDTVAIPSSSRRQALHGELARLVYVAVTRARHGVTFVESDVFSPVGLHLFTDSAYYSTH